MPDVPGDWVIIPAGMFSMGSADTAYCHHSWEQLHQVTLTHSFEMQTTEITQGDFLSLMGYNPSHFTSCGPNCPVDSIDWYQTAAYCNALSDYRGVEQCYSCTGTGADTTCSERTSYDGRDIYKCPGYRLPTEAEWEYAYRAGTSSTNTYYGNILANCALGTYDEVANGFAWYRGNSNGTTHRAGLLAPNSFGLYDMGGNVHEWCEDWFQGLLGYTAVVDPTGPSSGTNKVVRGGKFDSYPAGFVSYHRGYTAPTYDLRYAGGRCVRTLSP